MRLQIRGQVEEVGDGDAAGQPEGRPARVLACGGLPGVLFSYARRHPEAGASSPGSRVTSAVKTAPTFLTETNLLAGAWLGDLPQFEGGETSRQIELATFAVAKPRVGERAPVGRRIQRAQA